MGRVTSQENPPDFANSLAWALIWAARGRPVFPIWPIDPATGHCTCPKGQACEAKHGPLRGSHKNASTDPATIRKLWSKAAFAMRKQREEAKLPPLDLAPGIGGGTGNLIVLDIDSAAGFELWAEVQQRHGPAPATLTTASGRAIDDQGTRGAHIAFTIPADLDPAKRARLTLWGNSGLDGRCNGQGWVVLPPTLHRSGHRYVITNDAPIAVAPHWLVDFALERIDLGKGQKKTSKKRTGAAAPTTAPVSGIDTIPTPPKESLLFGAGYGVCWKNPSRQDHDLLYRALCAADPQAEANIGGRPSIERLTWLSVIWSLRAHERLWRDGRAFKLALLWSRQFASHTDESFHNTVWNLEPGAGQPHVGMQRIYDLADQNNPGWRNPGAQPVDAPHSIAYTTCAAIGNSGAGGGATNAMGPGNGVPFVGSGSPAPGPQPERADRPQNDNPPPPPGGNGPAPRLSKNNPSKTAEAFARETSPTLLRTNGDFLAYRDGAYRPVEADAIKSQVRAYLDRAVTVSQDPATGTMTAGPYKPKLKDVAEVVGALEQRLHRDRLDRPCWLNGVRGPAPESLIAFTNGILDTATGDLYEPNTNFFTRNARDFAYDPHAPKPVKWLAFLDSIFPESTREETIELLQRTMGYLVSGDISHHKIFLLLGPKRSGKGTILRVMTALVGDESTQSTTFSKLASQFGLQGLLGKSLALIPDAHMGHRTDRDVVVERLKSISGGDRQGVDRKHVTDWSGVLDARFVISANALPDLADASAALASRFVVLKTGVSFEGREDRHLYEDNIAPELPGIMLWALEGLRKLKADDRFILPESARQMRDSMTISNSPVAAFADEMCEFFEEKGVAERQERTPKSELFKAYCAWAYENKQKEISAQLFGKLLFAASGASITGLDGKVKTINKEKKRVDAYGGVRLKPPA